jgi:hypothetical protein
MQVPAPSCTVRTTTASQHMHLQRVLLWLLTTLLKLGKCHCLRLSCFCSASLSDCVLIPRHCLVCCSLRSAFVFEFAVGWSLREVAAFRTSATADSTLLSDLSCACCRASTAFFSFLVCGHVCWAGRTAWDMRLLQQQKKLRSQRCFWQAPCRKAVLPPVHLVVWGFALTFSCRLCCPTGVASAAHWVS